MGVLSYRDDCVGKDAEECLQVNQDDIDYGKPGPGLRAKPLFLRSRKAQGRHQKRKYEENPSQRYVNCGEYFLIPFLRIRPKIPFLPVKPWPYSLRMPLQPHVGFLLLFPGNGGRSGRE